MMWNDVIVMWCDMMYWSDEIWYNVGENLYKKKNLRSGCPPSKMAKHEASPPPDPKIDNIWIVI